MRAQEKGRRKNFNLDNTFTLLTFLPSPLTYTGSQKASAGGAASLLECYKLFLRRLVNPYIELMTMQGMRRISHPDPAFRENGFKL